MCFALKFFYDRKIIHMYAHFFCVFGILKLIRFYNICEISLSILYSIYLEHEGSVNF